MIRKQMIIRETKLIVDVFDQGDIEKFREIFSYWLEMNDKLTYLGGRALNVPDVLSEAIFCVFFDTVRINDGSFSWDCFDINRNISIQIKSTSIKNDCTSFGPKTEYDELYFLDFYNNGKIDGLIKIYKIDFALDNIVLNKKKNETFKSQQLQGRRPRLSLKNEIKKRKITPIKTVDFRRTKNENH